MQETLQRTTCRVDAGTQVPFDEVNSLAHGYLVLSDTMPNMDTPCWVSTTKCYRSKYRAVWNSDKKRPEYLHRVVYDHFYGIPEGLQINHTCNNQDCCRPDHLYAGTHKDNMRDMREKGTNRGINARLTKEQVLTVVHLLGEGLSAPAISRELGITTAQVANIKSGHAWSWLTGIPQPTYDRKC